MNRGYPRKVLDNGPAVIAKLWGGRGLGLKLPAQMKAFQTYQDALTGLTGVVRGVR